MKSVSWTNAGRFTVVSAILCAALAGAADTSVPEQAALRQLIQAHVDYAALAPDVRARTPRPNASRPPLSKDDVEQWRRALWTTWVEHVKETRTAKQIEFGDPWTKGGGIVAASWWSAPGTNQPLVMRYGTRVFGKKPEGGWPLYINLHAGGTSRAENDQCWALTRSQYKIETGLYLCPRALHDLAESWYDPVNYSLLDRILAEAIALWDVNPDKVYLMGFSMGGWGVMHLAPTLPDRWAAVSASAGAGFVGPTGRSAPDNLRNTPIIIQVGGNDLAYGRQPLSRAFAAALKAFHEKDKAGYEVEFKEHAGQGHQINDGNAPGWLARHTREPLPRRIVWQQPFPPPGRSREDIDLRMATAWGLARHYPGQVGWLRNPKPGSYQRVVASRDGNTVTIEEAEFVDELVILLDDRMADLDKPVRVLCGGKELASVTPKRTVDALIASLVARGDPRLMFAAELAVKPPDTTAALEGRNLTSVEHLQRRSRHRQGQGRFAEALDDLEALVKLDPVRGAGGTYKEMLALARTINDASRVAGTIRRWADADTGNAAVQEQAAQYFLHTAPAGQQDPAAALRFAQRLVALRPTGPGAQQTLAFALQANGKIAEAVAAIRKAMELLPEKDREENRRKLEETLKLFETAGTNRVSAVMPSGTNAIPLRIETEKVVIHTDLSAAQARHYGHFFDGFYRYFSTNYFPVVQRGKLEVMLFATDADYKAFDRFGPPRSPFGYHVPGKNTNAVSPPAGLAAEVRA